jgi:hypothetical protein
MTDTLTRDYLAGYETGYEHGIERGRQQVEDEWRGRMEAGAAVARVVAQAGPYAERAALRGQPERAARQRAILTERGIS